MRWQREHADVLEGATRAQQVLLEAAVRFVALGGRGKPGVMPRDWRCSPSMERSVKTSLSRSPTALFNVGVRSQSARTAGFARVLLASAARLARVQLASAASLVRFPVGHASAIGVGTASQCG